MSPSPASRPPLLGIYCVANGYEHDHSVCLMRDGQIDGYYPLERWSQVKYDNQLLGKRDLIFNDRAISPAIIARANILFADSFTPFDFDLFGCKFHAAKASSSSPIQRPNVSVDSNLVDMHPQTSVFSQEICHVFSNIPFYGTFPPKTLGIHIDGGASYSNSSAWLIDGPEVTFLDGTWNLHDDVNNFSTNQLTQIILGLYGKPAADLNAPGRLMGIAPYGTFFPDLYDWLVKHQWFMTTTPHQFLAACHSAYNVTPDLSNPLDPFLVNIARVMQENLTQKVVAYVRSFQQKTGAQSLAYAGGVALNIPANTQIARDLSFRSVMIPPCCNDTGLSIGACAYGAFSIQGLQTCPVHNPFLCNSDLDAELGPPEDTIAPLARALADGAVVGVAIGKGEAGPRALGHRSILASPRDRKMKHRVSVEIKHREEYRPLAPIVLEDVAKKIFVTLPLEGPAEFMLYDFEVRPAYWDAIPAVMHVDHTSRAQVIRESAPRGSSSELAFISKLLRTLWEDHHIPCLINTSFNPAGEPIVNSKSDSHAAAIAMGLDKLVLGNRIYDFQKYHN